MTVPAERRRRRGADRRLHRRASAQAGRRLRGRSRPELLAVPHDPRPASARRHDGAWSPGRPAAWRRRPSSGAPGGSRPTTGRWRFRRSRSCGARFVWSAFGRDPGAKRSVKPEYEPPADLIPAQAGALLDERAHHARRHRDGRRPGGPRLPRRSSRSPPRSASQDFMFKQPEAGRRRSRSEGRSSSSCWPRSSAATGRSTCGSCLGGEPRLPRTSFRRSATSLYRLMVQDGLFPASPGRVRAGWMTGGPADGDRSDSCCRSYGPSWLGLYEPWLQHRRRRERPDLRRLGLGHAAQDAGRRADRRRRCAGSRSSSSAPRRTASSACRPTRCIAGCRGPSRSA